MELDPLSPIINRGAGESYLEAGDYVRAVERLKKTLELNPNAPYARAILVRAYLAQGRAPELFEVFRGQGSRPEIEAELRAAYQEGGRRAFWRRSLELRIAETQKPCTDLPEVAAAFFALLREAERMFECLQQTVDEERAIYIGDPAFREYRTDPRFIAIYGREKAS